MTVEIVQARRTPIGSFPGAFQGVSAADLAATLAQRIPSDIKAGDVADLVLGNVLQA